MKKVTLIVILIAILVALSMSACIDKSKNSNASLGDPAVTTPVPEQDLDTLSTLNATATYGAEQLHLQLTAVANQDR